MRFDSGVQLQPSGKSLFVPLVLRARRIGAVRVRIEGIARIVDVGSIVEAWKLISEECILSILSIGIEIIVLESLFG